MTATQSTPGRQSCVPDPRTEASSEATAGVALTTVGQDRPRHRSAGRALARAVAVVSDGSALHHHGASVASESVQPLLRDDATLIHDLTGLPVLPVPVSAQDAEQLADRLADLPAHIGVVFLTETDPARARTAQHRLQEQGRPAVITDQDTTAIALAAATLTTLRHAGRTPSSSRVVIAGADTMPGLCPLLVATGIGDIGSWRQADAIGFPLHRIARTADVVIDLVRAATRLAPGAEFPGPTVLSPEEAGCPLLALPGLLSATMLAPHPRLGIGVHRACVLALAAATPPEKLLPDSDPSLTEMVASAVHRALHDHTQPGPHS